MVVAPLVVRRPGGEGEVSCNKLVVLSVSSFSVDSTRPRGDESAPTMLVGLLMQYLGTTFGLSDGDL